jgi:hypothetical protein
VTRNDHSAGGPCSRQHLIHSVNFDQDLPGGGGGGGAGPISRQYLIGNFTPDQDSPGGGGAGPGPVPSLSASMIFCFEL